MLNLAVITNDEKQAVHCRTLDEARILYYAVKAQRPDISFYGWNGPPDLNSVYADKAYMLSYNGCKSLKYGGVNDLRRMGVEIVSFDRLLEFELPDVEVNQTGILSLLGL